MIKYLVIILFSIFPLTNFAHDIKSVLREMPQEDRKSLEHLFYRVMRTDLGSYTLFGDKPMSLSGDFILTPNEHIFARAKCGGIFWKNWKVWKKYEEYFHVSKYLLIEEPSITCPNVNNVVFINKNNFIKKIKQNIILFKEILGQDITPDKLLQQIEETHKFAYFIKNNEILWGVLLGYGYHNAKLYHKKYELERFVYFDELPKLPNKKPTPSPEFSSIEEEIDFLKSKTTFFGDYEYSPLIQSSVHFLMDPNHPETKILEKKYRELRGKISAIYSQGDFLEITLSKLTSID